MDEWRMREPRTRASVSSPPPQSERSEDVMEEAPVTLSMLPTILQIVTVEVMKVLGLRRGPGGLPAAVRGRKALGDAGEKIDVPALVDRGTTDGKEKPRPTRGKRRGRRKPLQLSVRLGI